MQHGGGAIFIQGANSIISNNIFKNNTAYYGGAIITRATNITISKSKFYNNTAIQRAGAIFNYGSRNTIDNCSFINCSSLYADGVICIRASYATVSNSEFINATESATGGVAIRFYGAGYANVTNCNFINCMRTLTTPDTVISPDGDNIIISFCNFTKTGGVQIVRVNATVLNCNFDNMLGSYAIQVRPSGYHANTANNTHILGCTFKDSNNMFIEAYAPNTWVSNCTIQNCNGTARLIYVHDSVNCNISNISILNSNTTNDGLIYAANFVNFNLYNSTFKNNVATKGIVVLGQTLTNTTVSDCIFIDNHATGPGGAVYINAVNGTVTNCIFINNTDSNNAGAIYLNHKTAIVKYNVFINSTNKNNGIRISSGATVASNWFGTNNATAYHPGSSYLIAKLEKTSDDNVLVGGEYNPIVKIVFYDSKTNEAVNEAAIRPVAYTINVTNIQVIGSDTSVTGKILGNSNARQIFNITAKVDNQQLETLTFNDLTISISNSFKDLQRLINNTREGDILSLNNQYTYNANVENEPTTIQINKTLKIKGTGTISGANTVSIFNINADNVEIEGLTFTNANGGAIIWNGNNGKITNTKFTNNQAQYGGAIYSIGNNTQITGSIFTTNTAIDGSSLYIIGDNTLLSNSKFSNNKATSTDGVDVYIKGVKTTIFNVSEKDTNGNAIKVIGDNSTIHDLELNITHGKGLIVEGNNTNVYNINIIGGEGTSIIVGGDNTTIKNVTANNHDGGVIETTGNNTQISDIIANNNINGPVIQTQGPNTNIKNVTANGGNGTVIQTNGPNTIISDTIANNHTGNVIEFNGDDVQVINTLATNNTGDIVTGKGNNAYINGINTNGTNGTIADIIGDNAVVENIITENQIAGKNVEIKGKGGKKAHVDPQIVFLFPTNITGNYANFSMITSNEVTGYFAVTINGIVKTAQILNGKANINITDLLPGNHSVMLTYAGNEEFSQKSINVTINVPKPIPVITLIGNDLSILYSAKKTYSVQVLSDGNPIADNETVVINFNGQNYTVKTNKGYAMLDLITSIKVDKYTITSAYNGKTISNIITINNIISVKLKKLKKSKKVTKVKASLIKVDGKFLSGKLTLKIKGKKIATAKLKNGVATFKVKKNKLKKFKPGKYTATVTYGNDVVSKTIKIKK